MADEPNRPDAEFDPDAPTEASGPSPAPLPGSSEAIMGRPAPLQPGVRIDRYTLLEKLGEGGMGEVWRAEQTEPVHKIVAVKLIRPGLSSAAALERFELERKVLERLDHSNIARLLDAGQTDDGRPYFVMQHVQGTHITAFCRNNNLTFEERIRLLVQVAEAVQHAHLRGVIHRDLKPSNILVAWEGSKAVPKIIDFGVARATDPTLHAALRTSEIGKIIGTVEYMSPEQAEMSAEDIDLRTDVYSLGVVLYELLTDELPFPSEMLRHAAEQEMLRIIKEEQPRPPTWFIQRKRLSGPASAATATAERKTTGTRRLTRLVREDLDWIVLRCLKKRRDHRYASAGELAADLARFLRGEPIPRPVNALDGFRRFWDQHKPQMATAAAVAAALLIGAAVSLVMWQRAEASDAQGRDLAESLLREYHDQVLTLPGSIRARDALVTLGTEHLERMRRRAGGDPALLLAVADGYDRLGEIDGGLRTPHRGDLDAAETRYLEAFRIREAVLRDRPDDPDALVGLARSAMNLAEVERQRERIAGAVARGEEGLAYLDRLPPDAAVAEDARLARADLLVMTANMMSRSDETDDRSARLTLLTEADRLTEALVDDSPTDRARNARARALHNLGVFHLTSAPADEALAARFLDEAAEIRRFLFDQRPTNAEWRRDLAGSLVRAGHAHARLGDLGRANTLLDRARFHLEFLVEADPEDVEARRRLAQTLEVMAIETDRPRGPRRVALLEPAARLSREIVATGGAAIDEDRRMLGLHLLALGRNYRFSVADDSTWEHAVEMFTRSLETVAQAHSVFDELQRSDPSNPEWVVTLRRTGLEQARALSGLTSAGIDPPELRDRWRTLADTLARTLERLDGAPAAEAAADQIDDLRGLHATAQQQRDAAAEAARATAEPAGAAHGDADADAAPASPAG